MGTENQTSLGHIPDGRWVFDAPVAACFDDMLRRSIPGHDAMRDIVTRLALRFSAPGEVVLDLGCSRGESMMPLLDAGRSCVGYEVSEPMLVEVRARLAGHPLATIQRRDLREHLPLDRARVILSVLTLQFVPVEHRPRLLRDVRKALHPGGAFLLVEKVLGATPDVDDALVALHHDGKRAAGYSSEEVARKRLALEGVLVPLTASANVEQLFAAGFRQIDCVWRALNFAGWLALPCK